MTRKHFNAIAASLKEALQYVETPEEAANHLIYCEHIADTLRQFNRAFDRDRFLFACGC